MPIDPARAKSLFLAASELAAGAERASYLERECGDDADLRERVEALLAANTDAASKADVKKPGGVTVGVTADFPGRDVSVGAVIGGKYTLVEVIGEGGMGSVWRAKQTEPVKRFVAVKLIKAGMDSKQVLARFEAERQALALMDHPNISKVLDGGLHDNRPYFVMELVKGTPITEYCDTNKLNPPKRLELFVQACQAIQHAHQKGIIHRDIKPSNVLVALYDDKPVVKVIDFGVAKATGGALSEATIDTGIGGVVGTPQYMSPEQATFNNLDIDTRSDVYALGVLLYELLTGSPPFSKKELEKRGLLEMLRMVREEEPPRPSTKLSTADALPSISANRGTEPKTLTGLLRNELDWIVMKALEKDRVRRYETANGFAADVLRYLAGEAVLAHPPSRAYKIRKFVRRNKGQVIAACVIALSLLAGIVGTGWQAYRAQKAKELAESKRQEAEDNLTFSKKGNEILGSVFAGLDPKANFATLGELSQALKNNLKRAVKDLEGSAIGDPLTVAEMQDKLGVSLLGLGDAQSAVVVHEKALATRKAHLGEDHADTLTSMNNLGEAHRMNGQVRKALPLFIQALEKRQAKLGEDHPDTLKSMINLGQSHLVDGQIKKSLSFLEVTLEKCKAKLGDSHDDTLICMSSLAEAYKADGFVKKAISLLETVMEKKKANVGEDHPDTLMSMHNLANLYSEDLQPRNAIPLLEVLLEKTKVRLGADHRITVANTNSLAHAYHADQQEKRAIPLYEIALAKFKATLRPDHPDTLTTMSNLANAYYSEGMMDKAFPLFEAVLDNFKVHLGEDHPSTLMSMNNLANSYRKVGQHGKAIPLLQATMDISKVKMGENHPKTLASMHNLAFGHYMAGEWRKAIPLFEATFEKRKVHLGDDNLDTLTSLQMLGRSFTREKQWDQAVAKFALLIPGMRKGLPAGDSRFPRILADTATDLIQCGQFALAETHLRESLTLREKKDPEHWRCFETRSILGSALLGLKKYEEAETMLVQGYTGMKEREKNIHPFELISLSEALDRLIEFYTARSKPEEVKKYQELRAKYPPVKK